jgi:butyrate kinase
MGLEKVVEHTAEELSGFKHVFDQYPYRERLVRDTLEAEGIAIGDLAAVAGRGGLLKPMSGGVYSVSDAMVKFLKEAPNGEHPSNLGAVLARELARQAGGVPAFIVDAVTTDEFHDVARISGLVGLPRKSRLHALNQKAVARRVAAGMGKSYDEVNFIVVHLGSGVTVGAHKQGRVVDGSDATSEGPFSPERCGGLPADGFLELCFSGEATYKELKKRLYSTGGLFGYLGTKDVRQVEKKAGEGDGQSALLLDALAYQVAKEVGGQAAVLKGQVDRIILTGGIARSKWIVDGITDRVKFLAPVEVVPGEEELRALAEGALRVLSGREQAREFL